MTDLTTWLLTQIAAEEERARAATPGPWHCENAPNGFSPMVVGDSMVVADTYDKPALPDAAHIAANDPAATLRRCAAYRAIVEAHEPGPMLDHYEYGCTCGFGDHRWAECRGCGAHLDDEGEYDRGIVGRACPTLRALASIYADADGYDPSWRLG